MFSSWCPLESIGQKEQSGHVEQTPMIRSWKIILSNHWKFVDWTMWQVSFFSQLMFVSKQKKNSPRWLVETWRVNFQGGFHGQVDFATCIEERFSKPSRSFIVISSLRISCMKWHVFMESLTQSSVALMLVSRTTINLDWQMVHLTTHSRHGPCWLSKSLTTMFALATAEIL